MPLVKVSAFVTIVETREIEVTDLELAEFRSGRCADRIVRAINNDEGRFVKEERSSVEADKWELV